MSSRILHTGLKIMPTNMLILGKIYLRGSHLWYGIQKVNSLHSTQGTHHMPWLVFGVIEAVQN
jgi:hypothetical protein